MPASIAYHSRRRQRPFRVAGVQLSPRAVTTLPITAAVGGRPVFTDPATARPRRGAVLAVVMTPTKHHEPHRASASPVTVTPTINGIQSGVQHADLLDGSL